MPIMYQNNNPIQKLKMEKHTSVTQEEFDQMSKWHRQTNFTTDEMMGMVNLNRKYVNVHTPNCMSCHNNLRTTKNELMSFYLLHKDEIELRLNAPTETSKPKKK